jgi:hypothetical protein
VAKTHVTQAATQNLTSGFTVTRNGTWCQPVTSGSLFTPEDAYSNRSNRRNGSLVTYDTHPGTGEVLGVRVDQIGCVGYRGEAVCRLSRYWDTNRGVGPWVSSGDKVLEGAKGLKETKAATPAAAEGQAAQQPQQPQQQQGGGQGGAKQGRRLQQLLWRPRGHQRLRYLRL